MTALSFSRIPGTVRVPGTYFEFVPEPGSAPQNLRTLLIGQVLTGSPWASVTDAVLCTSLGAVRAAAGAGSMLARMAARYIGRDGFGEVWALPLLDDPAAAAAKGTITLGGAATAFGTLPLYIGGQLVSVLDVPGLALADLAASVVDTVNSQADLPVTATATAAAITLTAKHKGANGNDIDIRVAYRGAQGGEAVPAGRTVVVTSMAGGSANPQLDLALLALADLPFEVIACPYTDSGSLDSLKQLMDDNTGRWSWSRKLYGEVYTAKAVASLGVAQTFGALRNDPHVCVLPVGGSPTPPEEIAAELAACVMASVRNDPAIPIQYVPTGIQAPTPSARFSIKDRNTLLYDGLSTFRVMMDGTVELERLVTTYQTNEAGVPDISYLDVETLHTLGFVARDLDIYLTSSFKQVKLVADGTFIPGGVAMASPALIKATLDTRYRFLCDVPAVVQDAAGFAKESRVELAATSGNPGRVNIYAPVRLMGQLRMLAIQVAFSKPS